MSHSHLPGGKEKSPYWGISIQYLLHGIQCSSIFPHAIKYCSLSWTCSECSDHLPLVAYERNIHKITTTVCFSTWSQTGLPEGFALVSIATIKSPHPPPHQRILSFFPFLNMEAAVTEALVSLAKFRTLFLVITTSNPIYFEQEDVNQCGFVIVCHTEACLLSWKSDCLAGWRAM